MTNEESNAKAYWSATLSLLAKVLVIWALVSYGAGILFAPLLNGIYLGGYPLGFWFSQQGSIYVFIVLIFWYAKKMGDIDRKFGMQED
jgi:putative solute:sodium symporter small subunit